MECFSKRQLVARAWILIKKDFTNLEQRFYKKIDFYGKLTARIATLALGFDPKGMKPSDIQYKHSYQ